MICTLQYIVIIIIIIIIIINKATSAQN